jgi:Group XII secretory phospholipase A2 precursor (PLA2G12)
MSGELLDDLARTLAEPMPRRRAVRLLAGALVGAALPLGRPALGHAGTARAQRASGCAPNLRQCAGTGGKDIACCSPVDHCCIGGRDSIGNLQVACCPPGTTCCVTGIYPYCCAAGTTCNPKGTVCVQASTCAGIVCPPGHKCCGRTKEMPKDRCYDPRTQCCTPEAGVVAKYPIRSVETCPARVPRPGHKPKANGCGPEKGIKVPDKPFWLADFKPACDFHDICYETCRVPKSACDSGFLRRMNAICKAQYGSGVRYHLCRGIASDYYEAVSTLGSGAYEAAQKAACQCCP